MKLNIEHVLSGFRGSEPGRQALPRSMSLRFSLMGPVRACRDGQEVQLGPRQQRSVLAALLLNNGVWLSNDQLIGMVWDEPTPSAVMAVRTYMYRLRRTLPELDVKSANGGYAVNAEVLDDCQGEPLQGLQSAYFDAQRIRLSQQRLKAREDWLERELDVLELQKHSAAHPLRERPRVLLMYALYRDGRQAEALDQFHEARSILNQELGIEPGPELRALHESILRGDLKHVYRPEQLPLDLADFTGRETEIAQVLKALPATVGITGMHGSGKTTLATRIGHLVKHRFPDGQLFVRSTDVAGELLRAVGVENPKGDKAALWREKARGKRFLVIVDDVERAADVRDLATPGSAMILTSVRRLNELPGVTWVNVAGLAPQDAVAFLRTAIGHRVDVEPEHVEELLDRVSRLPLPIRVLGGKLASRPTWTVEMLLRQLCQEKAVGDATPVDCQAILTPLVRTQQELGAVEEHLLLRLVRRDTAEFRTVDVAEASGLAPDAIELAMEALADVHLVEPIELGRYRLPRFVQLYFGLPTSILTS
ncbi:AfsR/SARP family transcriptional regulator [Kibdelosporangium aridum]|uniref:AfsR/SARP family transcriptional regulator n=1 Tax=Kibdelosporangium aridum TaxID=2030 RepID=UPI0035EE61DF